MILQRARQEGMGPESLKRPLGFENCSMVCYHGNRSQIPVGVTMETDAQKGVYSTVKVQLDTL